MKTVHPAIAEPGDLLEETRRAAEGAGRILLEHFGHLQAAEIGRKSSSRDLVSAADLASERHLVEVLRELTPDFPSEAEEEVHDGPTPPGTPRWFLDPLDGTVNFVHGLPLFAVSLGLLVDGVP